MTISSMLEQALLSQAAYAENLTSIMTKEGLESSLVEFAGMSLEQAKLFANTFEVVEQQPTTESGFSATLFRNISDGSLHLGEQIASFQTGLVLMPKMQHMVWH